MIDYIKLKEAHELAEKHQEGITFTVYNWPHADYCSLSIDNTDFHKTLTFDELICKLQELTQDKPKPKYDLGQVVYFIDLPVNKIHQGYVKRIRDDEYTVVTDKPGPKEDYSEKDLYPSKQALIEHQIKYWTDALKQLPEFFQLTGQCSIGCQETHKMTKDDIESNQVKSDSHRCQHEPDGIAREIQEKSTGRFCFTVYKCKHCGEIYR